MNRGLVSIGWDLKGASVSNNIKISALNDGNFIVSYKIVLKKTNWIICVPSNN